jgi:hypothetical protein
MAPLAVRLEALDHAGGKPGERSRRFRSGSGGISDLYLNLSSLCERSDGEQKEN